MSNRNKRKKIFNQFIMVKQLKKLKIEETLEILQLVRLLAFSCCFGFPFGILFFIVIVLNHPHILPLNTKLLESNTT